MFNSDSLRPGLEAAHLRRDMGWSDEEEQTGAAGELCAWAMPAVAPRPAPPPPPAATPHTRRTREAVARRKKSRLRGAQEDGDGSEERPDRGGAPSGQPRRTDDAPKGVDGVWDTDRVDGV